VHDHIPAPCPGPCNNAWRRAETALEADGTEHHITPAWGQPVQCYSCVGRGREQLAELPELLAAVHLEALYGTPAKLAGTIGRVGAPVWPGQASRLLLDRILGEMEELANDIRDLREIARVRATGSTQPAREGRRITATVALLGAHWEWAMQHHPAAQEPHDRDNANPAGQVASWHRSAQFFTSRNNPRVQMAAPCPRCHLKTLAHCNGETFISCRNPECELLLSREEYDRRVKEMTEAITLGQAA
jgi:hypothetical protein